MLKSFEKQLSVTCYPLIENQEFILFTVRFGTWSRDIGIFFGASKYYACRE